MKLELPYTTTKIMAVTNKSRSFICRMFRQGKIDGYKEGGWRTSRAVFEKWWKEYQESKQIEMKIKQRDKK